ncbi:MAG: dienelactone hydrolase family protein [Burkholderiales bacterium]
MNDTCTPPSSAFGRCAFLLAAAAAVGSSMVHAQAPAMETFAPAGSGGPIVVIASGNSGTGLYREFSATLAARGYYVVLIDGKDISIRPNDPSGKDGAANLRQVLAVAESADKAIPGKAALVGFSIGGIGVLGYGAPLKEHVSAVVLFYPALTFIGSDLRPMVSAMQVPTLVFAGGADRFNNCCMLETMRALEMAPKSAPFELYVYPEAGHGFNLHAPAPLVFRQQDADDAWAKMLAFLDRYQPVKVKN